MFRIDITQAAIDLEQLVQRARAGEEIALCRGETVVARIVPEEPGQPGQPGQPGELSYSTTAPPVRVNPWAVGYWVCVAICGAAVGGVAGFGAYINLTDPHFRQSPNFLVNAGGSLLLSLTGFGLMAMGILRAVRRPKADRR